MADSMGGNIERSGYELMRDKQDRIERTLDTDDRTDAAYEAGFEAGYAKRAQLDQGAVGERDRLRDAVDTALIHLAAADSDAAAADLRRALTTLGGQ